jgi:hypothetical protein
MSSNPRNRTTLTSPVVPTEELEAMLTRLRLPGIRERLDGLLEVAARRQMNLREALAGSPRIPGPRLPGIRGDPGLAVYR